ncbi:MAG: hypothetical protein ACRDX8_07045 [Acidimicrobiales bacterium]
MTQVFDLGAIEVSDWTLYLLGDEDADVEIAMPNGVAAAADGVVSIFVGTDIGTLDVSVELREGAPGDVVIQDGDDVVEFAWRPVGDEVVLQTTSWALEVEPIMLLASPNGSYVVQVHSHNRDAVADLLEVPEDFADRERLVIRIWPGDGPPERVLALQSRTARALWIEARGAPPNMEGDAAPKEVALFPIGEAVAVPVSYHAFILRDEGFVVPSDFSDNLALSVAKMNTLVSNVPGHVRVTTGTERGEVNLTVRLVDQMTTIHSRLEGLGNLGVVLGRDDDAVLVAHETSGKILLEGVGRECHFALPPLAAGRYAMLVVARGRDNAYKASERRGAKAVTPRLEEVLVVLWPDPARQVPDETVLQVLYSEFARIMRFNDDSVFLGHVKKGIV